VGDSDGHCAEILGTASGLMNYGSALAAILSPVVAGMVTDMNRRSAAAVVIAIAC